jgi:hypothetical protein
MIDRVGTVDLLGCHERVALLGLLARNNPDKDIQVLPLRHQTTVLQRQLSPHRVRFAAADRAFLAAILNRIPRVAQFWGCSW